MQFNLPTDLEPFIEQEFATGRYASRDDVLIYALKALRDERQEAVKGIEEGLADATAGRVLSLTETFNELRRDA